MTDETTAVEVRTEAPPTSVESVLMLAVERGASVEALERIMEMGRQHRAEQAKAAYFEALSAFQDECPVIPKTKHVDAFGSGRGYSYAPLEVIIQYVQPLLRKHGLSYRFDTAFEAQPPAQVVTCTVYHREGHLESSHFRTPVSSGGAMNEMQKSASAQTYAKRYAFCNALGILTGDEDDDGRSQGRVEGAGRRDNPNVGHPAPSTAAPAPGTPLTRGNVVKLSKPPAPGPTSVRDVLMQRGYSEADLSTPDAPPAPPDEAPAQPEHDPSKEIRRQIVELAFEFMRGKAGSPAQGPGKGKPPTAVGLLQAEAWANAAARKTFPGKNLAALDQDELTQLHDKMSRTLDKGAEA